MRIHLCASYFISCYCWLSFSRQTPTKKRGDADADAEPETPPRSASKRGAFGRTVDGASPMKESVAVPPEVKRVYSLVNKATGAIGGNGESSPAEIKPSRMTSTLR